MQKIKYLSSDRVEWVHGRILELTDGDRGDVSKGNLEFILAKVENVGERLDRDRAIVKKAAFLLYNLVTRHPFVNGNKRTALEVVQAFLELNGYTIQVKKDEAYMLLSDIAAGKALLSRVENWTITNLAKIRQD
ncbi:MAG TPA: type II toxin-antitoxin system death-on-curing family toxin [Candidatus Bathyarchaeia archaeon]|jgi:death-on-curing protein|nr:type II toxin-antitoxin system death-on-curing family toxin [Candidatus Bathyarchaeia archaeon]